MSDQVPLAAAAAGASVGPADPGTFDLPFGRRWVEAWDQGLKGDAMAVSVSDHRAGQGLNRYLEQI